MSADKEKSQAVGVCREGSLEACRACGKLVYPEGVVVMPAGEYAAVLRRAGEAEKRNARFKPFRAERLKIARDPEVCAFVLELSESKGVREIVEACVARFGKERAPSKNTVYRFQSRASNRVRGLFTALSSGE